MGIESVDGPVDWDSEDAEGALEKIFEEKEPLPRRGRACYCGCGRFPRRGGRYYSVECERREGEHLGGFGSAVNDARVARGLTWLQLAGELRLGYSTLIHFTGSNRRYAPSAPTMCRVATHLGLEFRGGKWCAH